MPSEPVTRSVVTHRSVIACLTVAAMFGLAACTQTTIGNGTPANTTASTDPTGDSSASSTSSSTGASMKSIQPCSLLSAAVLNEYQLSSSDVTPGSGARPCDWDNVTDNDGIGYSVELDIRDSQGIKDFNTAGYTIAGEKIGRHQGQQATENAGGGCIVTIGVTDSSRVDVVVTAGTDTSRACDLANQFAKLIEPQLP
jgi:hypothetical protein